MLFYSLVFNISMTGDGFLNPPNSPMKHDENFLGLKVSVDNAIIKYLSRKKGVPEVDIPYMNYSF